MCVLYPLGDQYVTFFKDTDKTASGYHLRTEIKKALGREVPIGVFADEQHNYVSAVIWSKTTLGNFFYDHNDLTLYPNTTPDHPLPAGWLDWAHEWEARVVSEDSCELKRIV